MSLILTPAATWNPSVTVPQGGDSRTAGSVQVPFQALTDRSELLYSVCCSGEQQIPLMKGFGIGSFTGGYLGAGIPAFIQGVTNDTAYLPVCGLGGLKVTGMRFDGATGSGGHSAMPTFKASVMLLELPTNAIPIVLSPQLFASPSTVSTYDQPHTTTITGLNILLSKTKRYAIELLGESGTNSLSNGYAWTLVSLTVAAP